MRTLRGMSLIDVIFGVFIMLVVFLGIFGAFMLSIDLVYNTKAKAGAVSLITERVELVRSLPYNAVGTVGGIPPGNIPQLSQETLNGILYTIRTFIRYEDAPEDGEGNLDENGITTDYKVVKVEALWSVRGISHSTFAVSRVAPRGIETIAGGGTLRVNVINSLADPVPGASVRVANPGASPAIDVTTFTNANGSVIFPGSPSATGYEISVSKEGYSEARTYDVTVENPNPNPGHITIAEGVTSTLTLSIDLLASLRIFSYEAPGLLSFEDRFDGEEKLSATSSVAVAGGELMLRNTDGSFASSGNALSLTISPQYLASWDELSWNYSTPPGTFLSVQVYYFDGNAFSLVPDDVLPGNGAGFTTGLIDLSTLPVATYKQLRLGALLATGDPLLSPSLSSWKVDYVAGPSPLPGVSFGLRSTKTIGTTGGGIPIYKLNESYTTDQYGELFIDSIEPDMYVVSVSEPGYDLAERCPFILSIMPGSDAELAITLHDETANSLLVRVEGGGAALPNASILLAGPATRNALTSACGQTFFPALSAGTYTVTISAPGYATYVENVSVDGANVLSVPLATP